MNFRKTIIFILVLASSITLLNAVSAVGADTPATIAEENQSLTVSLDYSKLVPDANKIRFTVDSIPATTTGGQAYMAFDKLAVLGVGVDLSVYLNEPDYYAYLPENLKLSWRLFSNVPIEIIVKLNGPLYSANTNDKINWQVSVVKAATSSAVSADARTTAGTLENTANFDYASSELLAYKHEITDPATGGTCELGVKTQSLWFKDFKDYTGQLIAEVRPL